MKHNLYQRLKSPSSINFFLFGLISILFLSSCTSNTNSEKTTSLTAIEIIPVPSKMLYKRGYFQLSKSSRILMNLSDENSKAIGAHLLTEIKKKTGYQLKIADRFTTSKLTSSIEIITDPTKPLNLAGFKIEIKNNRIKLYALDKSGLFYGANTLINLVTKKDNNTWQAPQLIIEDYPQTNVRGVYIPFDSIPLTNERLINLLTKNRINHLISPIFETTKIAENLVIYPNTSFFGSGFQQDKPTIKKFYTLAYNKNDTLMFELSSIKQLHPDSIAIIGEAMWSKPTKRNYNNIKKRLTELN